MPQCWADRAYSESTFSLPPSFLPSFLPFQDKDPELFVLAKVGLGCLGVAAEVTLRCVPAHRLVERTWVATPKEVRRRHTAWLKENQHLRYMWIPSTDAVVVVTNNPATENEERAALAAAGGPPSAEERAKKVEPLRTLLLSHPDCSVSAGEAAGLSATQLRDALLAIAPLDAAWVQRVNAAEAEFWRRSAGVRAGWSDELLGFDCGGQQWVLESAFPTGTVEKPDGADLRFMSDLLALIEKERVPAPAPIEQRWTSGSSAPMSPAAGPPGSLHSWVGVIMYLPSEEVQRKEVTNW
jgi:L-galactono-1,4-lactone dehydrogenase